MKKDNNLLLAMTLIALSFVAAGCNHAAKEHGDEPHHDEHANEIVFTKSQAKEAGLQLETVSKGAFTDVIKVGGQILSTLGDDRTIVATAAGIVTFPASAGTEGAAVGQGQSVATISAKSLQDGDPLQKARVAYEAAEQEYSRAGKLVADRIISAKEYEQARLGYETAKAAYQGMSSSVTSGGVSVASPIAGYIKSRQVRQGDYVSVGDPIMTVTRNRRLQLRAEMPESGFRSLRHITGANFRLSGDKSVYKLSDLNGRLLSYGKASTADSYYVPVVFEFDNVGDFVAGMYAEVYLLCGRKDGVVSLPVGALTEEQGVYYVYVRVKGEDEAYRKQEVQPGPDNGDRVEILGGLSVGDEVVVKGAYQVRLASASAAIPEGHSH